MKFKVILLTTLMLTSGCSSHPWLDTPAEFSGANPGCKSQSTNENGQVLKSTVCVKKTVLKPSKYFVKVENKVIFYGTDYKKVKFNSSYLGKTITGGCDASVNLSVSRKENIQLSKLPPELIEGCGIKPRNNGQAAAFLKDDKCDKVFYKHLAPLLGKIFPVEGYRVCKINLDNNEVYNQKFYL